MHRSGARRRYGEANGSIRAGSPGGYLDMVSTWGRGLYWYVTEDGIEWDGT